ncbi:MAG TPA: dienelactone hydrolase family protein [Candidatus Eisenbacteria bacterium]|nr:dienelactone hydrolase family protein [Candidatus Eisenbacteria bacterium]
MERKRAGDYPQDLLNLFDQYVHGGIDRRAFLVGAARFAVGGVTAAMLLDELSPKFAEAQQVPPDDKRLDAKTLEYKSSEGSGTMKGYLARPASAKGKELPGILVIHENRGLNPHIEDVTRRLALDGFMAFAPDALTPLGGYPGTEDKARELFQKLDQSKTREDFLAAANLLRKRDDATGKIGAVGFCYGGGMVNYLATRMTELDAGVAFYGNQVPAADVPKIKAPLLLHFAETDERINAGWPAYEAALQEHKKKYEAFFYPGTQHGFNNDTTPRYDAAAAKLAWSRTVEFFKKHLT